MKQWTFARFFVALAFLAAIAVPASAKSLDSCIARVKSGDFRSMTFHVAGLVNSDPSTGLERIWSEPIARALERRGATRVEDWRNADIDVKPHLNNLHETIDDETMVRFDIDITCVSLDYAKRPLANGASVSVYLMSPKIAVSTQKQFKTLLPLSTAYGPDAEAYFLPLIDEMIPKKRK